MTSVSLGGTTNSGSASLSLFDAQFRPDRSAGSDVYWMECRARLDADGESTEVELSMILPYREDTLAFFEALSSRPNGWRGGANWYSEAMELNINVQGSGDGLVTLHIELRRFAHLDPAATGEIDLSFDEIRQFTRSLGGFLRVYPAAPTEVPAAESPLGRWSFTDSPLRETEAFE